MDLLSKAIGILITIGFSCCCYEFVSGESNNHFHPSEPHSAISVNTQNKLVEKCCQVGKSRAIESQKFNCKLSAREALIGPTTDTSFGHQITVTRATQLLALAADSLLSRDPSFADQCEMVLESCCLAHHRTRNCDSGKQLAKSGAACMDVELSKEATVATESFNDCCMACSLGVLAARNPSQNETNGYFAVQSNSNLAQRCKLISPLASSLSGQLYEQTYIECCQENLPRLSSTLIKPGTPINCEQSNPCSHRCLSAGSLDPITREPIDSDRCDCFSGYKLGFDGATCLDIDECKLNLHTCNKSDVCENTRGSFKCLARVSQYRRSTSSSSSSSSWSSGMII